MPFQVPTLDESHAILLADHQNRFPGDDVSRFSDTWKRLRTKALAVTALHAHIDVVDSDLMPDTATGPRLDRWGTILNVPRKLATPSFGTAVLRCFGTVAAAVTASTLSHQDGTTYKCGTGVIGAGGFVDVDLNLGLVAPFTGFSTGSITRKTAGEVLTFVAPPAGITSTAELQADLDHGGEDDEPDGTYRVRLLDKMAAPGMGGNANDYRAWALSQDGVATAYVYPLRQGLGSVDVAFLHAGRGAARLPTGGEITAVKTYIDTQRPVSVADFRVLTAVAEPNDVEILVSSQDAAHDFDWDDTLPPTVSAWNGTTRVLTFSLRPADIVPKDRVIYKSAAPNDGAELVVEALGPGGNDVTVQTLTPAQVAAPPVATNLVYSGGPLVEPLRQAILDLFDLLGPARGTNPAQVAGLWEGTLRPATLFKIAQLSEGVLDSSVVIPASNVTAANAPPIGTVGQITPRRVLVRRG